MKEQTPASKTFILFQIGDTSYGVPSDSVQQMELIENITPVPNAADFVEGVVFTRGQVIPAINLRSRFGFGKVPHTPRSRLIVTNHDGRIVGLIVDSAREFISIPNESIQPPPEAIAGTNGKYLKGIVTIDGRIILVLDIGELLTVGELRTSAASG